MQKKNSYRELTLCGPFPSEDLTLKEEENSEDDS